MSCPASERLRELMNDALPEPESREIQAHLESCAACQRTLDELAARGESWSNLARNLAPGQGSDKDPVLQKAVGALAGAASSETSVGTQAEPGRGAVDLSFLEPSTKPSSLGRLGHYDILEVIGTGGMGVVLKAYDEKLQRVVAVKALFANLATNPTARKRFIREARAAAAVSHDHLVAIYAVEETSPVPYLVMQCVIGQSLQEKLDRQGPLGVKEILRIGLQTAEGLAAAHKQGLIHRDIKPANILLENGVERVKITDFGLARAVDDSSLTQSGVVAGTPMYMAPEQAAGEACDPRADLFSLGSVLYVLCTGQPPFTATGSMAVMKRVIEETPRPIRAGNPDVPEWLAGIIAKLHAKKPAERFQSATEVADLLGRHLAHLQQPGTSPLPAPVSVPKHAPPVAAEEEGIVSDLAMGSLQGIGYFVLCFVVIAPMFWLLSFVIDLRRPADMLGAAAVCGVLALAAYALGRLVRLGRARRVLGGLAAVLGLVAAGFGLTGVRNLSRPVATLTLQWFDPTLEVSVTPHDGAAPTSVRQDEAVSVAPGRYTLVARKTGAEVYSTTLSLHARDQKTIRLPEHGTLIFEAHDPELRLKVDGVEWTGNPEKGIRIFTRQVAIGVHAWVAYDGAGGEVQKGNHLVQGDGTTYVQLRPSASEQALVGPAVAAPSGTDDAKALQGVWQAVTGDMDGGQALDAARLKEMTLSFYSETVRVTMPGGRTAAGTFTLDPSKSPRHITIIDKAEKKGMLGIYALEGDKLRLCMSNADEEKRPEKFASRQGSSLLNVAFERKQDSSAAGTRRFDPAKDLPITAGDLGREDGGWKFESKQAAAQTVRLFELRDLPVENCQVTFRARLKTGAKMGQAPIGVILALQPTPAIMLAPNIWLNRIASQTAATGDSDWETYEANFSCRGRPRVLSLNLESENLGTVWLKDVELTWQPLAKRDQVPPSELDPQPEAKPRLLRRYEPGKDAVLDKNVKATKTGWLIEQGPKGQERHRLFELRDLGLGKGAVIFRARLKTEPAMDGPRLLAALGLEFDPAVQISKDASVYHVSGQTAAIGPTNWALYEVRVDSLSEADKIGLYVRVEGAGTVWIEDVELLHLPK